MILPSNNKIPEQWKRISDGIPIVEDYYFVSNWGRVFNSSTDTYLPQNIYYNKNKYINIRLKTKDGNCIQEMMQRIVLKVFRPNSNQNELEVDHIDSIKYHNWVWNLRWVTHDENMKLAVLNNNFHYGENHHNSKITEDQVRYICELLEEGYTTNEIINWINIPNINMKSTINNIRNKHCWANVSKDYNIGNLNSSTTREKGLNKPIYFV